MMRLSVQPQQQYYQSNENKQQIEQLKLIVDNQAKTNSKAVRVAIDETKKSHTQIKHELAQIREQAMHSSQYVDQS